MPDHPASTRATPFAIWLAAACDVGDAAEGARELTGDLYRSFRAWAVARGHDRIMGSKAFGDALRDRQIGLAGKNEIGLKYRGPIRLRPDYGNAGRFMASVTGGADGLVWLPGVRLRPPSQGRSPAAMSARALGAAIGAARRLARAVRQALRRLAA